MLKRSYKLRGESIIDQSSLVNSLETSCQVLSYSVYKNQMGYDRSLNAGENSRLIFIADGGFLVNIIRYLAAHKGP